MQLFLGTFVVQCWYGGSNWQGIPLACLGGLGTLLAPLFWSLLAWPAKLAKFLLPCLTGAHNALHMENGLPLHATPCCCTV